MLVFSDVWGPAMESFGRYKYYVTFIDDYSKFTWIYLLRRKSDVYNAFCEFQKLVERMFDRKILAFQFDWGGEYEKLNQLFKSIGIHHQVSCPHSHQQNGAAERKHHHIVEVGLALLATASMPLKYWDHAFLTATYLINTTPSKVIDHDTPLHKLTGATPDYSSLHTFGCACWPNLHPYNSHKLQFRSTRCVFLGYSNMHKGFKCLDISSGRIYISRDVVFDEKVFPFAALPHNAGVRYTADVLLLPSQSCGDDKITDNANHSTVSVLHVPSFVQHGVQGGVDSTSNNGAPFLGSGDVIDTHAASTSDQVPHSAGLSGSTPAPSPTTPVPDSLAVAPAADAPIASDTALPQDDLPPGSSAVQMALVPVSASEPRTRLQHGITKPKRFMEVLSVMPTR
jgi:hypothetical protein